MNRDALMRSPLPMDRVASRVVRGKGEHWEPARYRDHVRNLPMIAPPADCKPLPDGLQNIKGLRRGKAVAHCYLGRTRHGHAWVIRCDCGLFEIRRMRNFVKFPDAYHCCSRCDDAHFARTGVNLSRAGITEQRTREGAINDRAR